MIHSRLVVYYVMRRLGWLGISILILATLTCGFGVQSVKDWVFRAELYKLLLFCVLVLFGLHWGREQRISKVSMMSEVRPSSRWTALMGEALGLCFCAGLFLILAVVSLILGEHYVGPQIGGLLKSSPTEYEIIEEADWQTLTLKNSQGELLGLKVAFMEGETMSDLTYYNARMQSGATITLKAMREVLVEYKPLQKFPRKIRIGGRVVNIVFLEVRALAKHGQWWHSLYVWFCYSMLQLLILSILLILLGKHVSLELGLVVILTIVLAQVLLSVFDEGDVGRLIDQMNKRLSSTQASSRFEQRWWEIWLLSWSNLLGNMLSTFGITREGAQLSVVNNGYAYQFSGDGLSWLLACILATLSSIGLDTWWRRYRLW